MVECEYCEKEFEDETELHLHWGEEHEDELNSHEKEKVKKAEREKDKQKQRKKAKRKEYKNYALLGIVLVGLVAGGAALIPKLPSGGGGSGLGPAGSAHTHADFMVVVDGEPVDFERRGFMVADNKVHIEGMNGDVVHGHASGSTFRYFLNTLGFDYNATYLKTPNNEYYENGKQVKMFVETGGDWREIEPKAFRFETGDRILLTYGNYSESEIEEYQGMVTDQSSSMS